MMYVLKLIYKTFRNIFIHSTRLTPKSFGWRKKESLFFVLFTNYYGRYLSICLSTIFNLLKERLIYPFICVHVLCRKHLTLIPSPCFICFPFNPQCVPCTKEMYFSYFFINCWSLTGLSWVNCFVSHRHLSFGGNLWNYEGLYWSRTGYGWRKSSAWFYGKTVYRMKRLYVLKNYSKGRYSKLLHYLRLPVQFQYVLTGSFI